MYFIKEQETTFNGRSRADSTDREHLLEKPVKKRPVLNLQPCVMG
ncbi:hypothetical protein NBRC111894_3280 [Sporolactobacillus inulinus]|uniref:Uncharacterized protein n=1 Tax=Sporolactobacillus inulinus TaxID=2078 RepID=A0A4Y1ZEY1_9BACL|nr:hypothetical protein NBRC111894_3280 [Sporolactobacillus inulinus]